MTPIDPRLGRLACDAPAPLAVGVLSGIALAGLVVAQAWFLAAVVAGVVEGRGETPVTASLVGLALVVVGRALVTRIQDAAGAAVAATVKAELRQRLVRRAAHDAVRATARRPRAEIVALATSGLDALDPYFARYAPQLVATAVVPPVAVVVLALTDVPSAVIVALTLPLIPVFMVLVGRATEAASARRWDALVRLGHHFLDVVEGMPTLRAFGRGRAQAELIRASSDGYRRTTLATLRIAFLSSLVLELLATLSVALVAVSVGLRLVDGRVGLQAGLLAILLAPEASAPLRSLGAQYHNSAAGVSAADEAFEILGDATDATDATVAERPGALPPGGLTVVVEDVTVRHAGRDRPAPDRLSFVARPGRVTCVAGPSGTGKSTLFGVLLAERAPDDGSVGVEAGAEAAPFDRIGLDAWRAAIGWIDQYPFLAEGTVADNVRLSRPDATDDEVAEALRRAALDLPLDRAVGPRGTRCRPVSGAGCPWPGPS